MCVAQILWDPCAPCSVPLWIECIQVQQPVTIFLMSCCVHLHLSVFVISPAWLCAQACCQSGTLQYFQWAVEAGREPLDTWDRLHNLCSGREHIIFTLMLHWSPVFSLILLNSQGRAGYVTQGSNIAHDRASQPLFSNINESKLSSTTTLTRKCLPQKQNKKVLLFLTSNPLSDSPCWQQKLDFCVCRVHRTPGQLREVLRRGWTSHSRGADGD